MKKAPYHDNPGNACALACYTMEAQYLLPDEKITFEQFGKIADWHPGYVVWAFPVWSWLMDRGVKITDYDVSDKDAWEKKGVKGLQESVSPREFKFYKENTYDLEAVTEQMRQTYAHPNFTYVQKKLTWDDVVKEVGAPGICDMTIDGRKLNRKEGFSVHRVVLIDITDDEVIFHDPNKEGNGAYRREPIKHFRAAMDSLSGAELAHYSLK